MYLLIFFMLLSVELVLLTYVLIKTRSRTTSIWPPRGNKKISISVLMVIFYLIIAGSVWVCIHEWRNPFIQAPWVRYSGLLITGLGLLLYAWCRIYISKNMEFGGKDHLITKGPYEYTRNPLYIADTFIFLGFALISNSLLVMILMIVLVTTLLLLPFIEEPWLLEQYGEHYKNYMEKVPRYIRI